MSSQLSWSILDVEEDEWDRYVASQDATVVANCALTAAQPNPVAAAADNAFDPLHCRAWRWRPLTIGVAVLLTFAGLIGYNVWRTAQAGLALIEADIANVVKIENLKAHPVLPSRASADSVASVELLGDTALAQVVISSTLQSGKVVELRQARFYRQVGAGWQRTEPVAAFWGASSTLDTTNLHFVFGALDRAAVKQVAPTAETLYANLIRATGQKLAARGKLTIEIAPGRVREGAIFVNGRIRVTSPMLFFLQTPVPPMSQEELLARLLHDAMCEPMLAAVKRQTHVKRQWQPLIAGFSCQSVSEGIVAQTPAAANIFDPIFGTRPLYYLKLKDLLDEGFAPGSASGTQNAATTSSIMASSKAAVYISGQGLHFSDHRTVAAAQLVAFVAATYGLDSLPRLLRGCGEYDDWESLSPAVLGTSAAELEAAWRAGALQ